MAPASRATQQRRNTRYLHSQRFATPVGVAYFLMFSEFFEMRKVLKLTEPYCYTTDALFALLQVPQSICKFSGVLAPPNENGII